MTSSTDLVINPDAERDIQEILQYTLDTWGDDQVTAYWSVIWEAFQRIRTFPNLGRLSPYALDELEFVLEHHTIVYQYATNTVTILRIVNPRRKRR